MANPIPTPESQRSGLNGDRRAQLSVLGAGRDRLRHDTPQSKADVNGWDDIPGEPLPQGEALEGGSDAPGGGELVELRAENTELRLENEKLTQQLDEARQLEEAWNER